MSETKIPTLSEIQNGIVANKKMAQFIELINSEPLPEWVCEHPFIRGYKYIPVGRIEMLLNAIFQQWRIEILSQGSVFNGCYVVVRLHYIHPITGNWLSTDGIGASQVQTKKGASAADLANINNNAVALCFPAAKTAAFKDAAGNLGSIFGSNLNRRDITELEQIKDDVRFMVNDWDYVQGLFEDKEAILTDKEREHALRIINNREKTSYKKVTAFLENKQ